MNDRLAEIKKQRAFEGSYTSYEERLIAEVDRLTAECERLRETIEAIAATRNEAQEYVHMVADRGGNGYLSDVAKLLIKKWNAKRPGYQDELRGDDIGPAVPRSSFEDMERTGAEQAKRADENQKWAQKAEAELTQARTRIERVRDYVMRVEENEITAPDILEVLGYSRDGMTDEEAQDD